MRDRTLAEQLLDDEACQRLSTVADVVPNILTPGTNVGIEEELSTADVLLTGWGAPTIDARFLQRAPRLQFVAHAAGSLKRIATDEAWDRGIRFSSAADANGIPVAEYALAMILLSGKRVFEAEAFLRCERQLGWSPDTEFGNNNATVGIIGASRIGRRVLDLLRPFNFRVLLSDPTVDRAEATRLGAELVPLPALLAQSSVVSLHAPLLVSTTRMIGPAELALMPTGATLINTARGALVDTDALVAELAFGRLHAVLDVTDPEPLPADHPLYTAPGTVLTPHVAGALGNELTRLGRHAVDEIERFASSSALATEVHADILAEIA